MPYVCSCSMLCSKAITMFEDDERFSAVERPREREDLFESYLMELQKKVLSYRNSVPLLNFNWCWAYLFVEYTFGNLILQFLSFFSMSKNKTRDFSGMT